MASIHPQAISLTGFCVFFLQDFKKLLKREEKPILMMFYAPCESPDDLPSFCPQSLVNSNSLGFKGCQILDTNDPGLTVKRLKPGAFKICIACGDESLHD